MKILDVSELVINSALDTKIEGFKKSTLVITYILLLNNLIR